jgi:hypothetical protein
MEKYTKRMLQENNRRRKQVIENDVPDFNHKNSIVYLIAAILMVLFLPV